MELRINTDIWTNDLLTSSDNHQTRQAYNAEVKVRYPSPTTLRTKAQGDENHNQASTIQIYQFKVITTGTWVDMILTKTLNYNFKNNHSTVLDGGEKRVNDIISD